ncbi:histidine phosphatase family protein [Lachnospiraceae bacterium OttesenSCG-928-D06]|nr:histidine phosphatase family protein [Lachnospiraceae bacterium OttesenSCG-928-D06]
MKIHLYRHGETQWNSKGMIQGQTDTSLNENGLNQAKELAKRVKASGIVVPRIYTSPQKRAKNTADAIAEILGVPCVSKDGLKEICFGLWEGKTWEEVEKEYGAAFQTWYHNRRYQCTPEGESYQMLLERVVDSMKEIVAENANESDVIIVAHSAVILTLQSWLNDTPFHEMVKRYKTKNAQGVVINSAAIYGKEVTEENI